VAEVFFGLRTHVGMLDNQIALIVGAGGGIGRAVVSRYLREGASVLAVDRAADRLESLKREVAGGDRLCTLAANATSWESSEAIVQETVNRFGGFDVLVSCVGVYDQAIRLVEIPGAQLAEAFDECFRGNVGSLLLNIRAAIPQLAARKGRVVVTGSFASYRTSGGGVLYTAAKHAVMGLVSQLAFELAPKIRVNGVAPGVAQTMMSGLGALGQSPKSSLLPGTEKQLPLETMPDTHDYGAIYALLGSARDSAAMTGSMVVVDSGLLVRGLAAPNRGGDL
jgi:NAD(P)-dependent dehydrogenase (short-subunit alcohol dehydrogenase family)